MAQADDVSDRSLAPLLRRPSHARKTQNQQAVHAAFVGAPGRRQTRQWPIRPRPRGY